MNSEEFVAAIRRYIRDVAIEGNLSLFADPPGRAPRAELVAVSKWYNGLDDYGKQMVRQVVSESVDAGLFALLCVLDDVNTIDEREPQGKFKLYYVNENEQILLNDFDQEFLHDIYNAE